MSETLELLTIDGTEIAPGKTAEILLNIARLPTHTQIDLPLHVFRGKNPGPSLLLTAGLHGDEVNGTETLRRMLRQGLLMPDAGTVLVMPIVNVFGFIHNIRDLPDGKDLNRSFPGSKSGSLARRLAHILMSEVIPHADYGIDLHTGGASRTNFPQIRCDFTRPESLGLAKAFGAPFMINSNEIEGSFRKAACDVGKTIVVYEGGESRRLDEWAIREAMLGIQRVMNYLKMTDRPVLESASMVLVDSKWVRAKVAGIFCPFIEYGTEVREGEVLAHIGDPYGEMVHDVVSPHTGFVIGLNHHPITNVGEALFHIGWPAKEGEELAVPPRIFEDPDADLEGTDDWLGYGGA